MNFNNTIFLTSYGEKKQFKKSNCKEIVFSGRSNVGKSSLINKLINKKSLARVSSRPGKTSTINLYKVNDYVRLVDLPGYGYAKVSESEKLRWSDLVEGYFNSGPNIVLVIQIIDIRHKPSMDDITMIKFLIERKLKFIIVLTKSDKLNRTQRKECLDNLKDNFPFENIDFIIFSSSSGEGLENLKAVIEESIK